MVQELVDDEEKIKSGLISIFDDLGKSGFIYRGECFVGQNVRERNVWLDEFGVQREFEHRHLQNSNLNK